MGQGSMRCLVKAYHSKDQVNYHPLGALDFMERFSEWIDDISSKDQAKWIS